MALNQLAGIERIGGIEELTRVGSKPSAKESGHFSETLKEALSSVDDLQRGSESVQASYVRGEGVDLHDVLIKVEQAEIAFKGMMEVRNKLIEAYHEVMRMGSGG